MCDGVGSRRLSGHKQKSTSKKANCNCVHIYFIPLFSGNKSENSSDNDIRNAHFAYDSHTIYEKVCLQTQTLLLRDDKQKQNCAQFRSWHCQMISTLHFL